MPLPISKSRIPVSRIPVSNQKSSNLNNREKDTFNKKPAPRLKTSCTTKVVGKDNSQLRESEKVLNHRTMKVSNFKNNVVQSSLKTSIKCNDTRKVILKSNINCNATEKKTLPCFKTHVKSSVDKTKVVATTKTGIKCTANEKETLSVFKTNVKPSANKSKVVPTAKTNIQSSVKEKKNLVTSKTNIQSSAKEKKNLAASKTNVNACISEKSVRTLLTTNVKKPIGDRNDSTACKIKTESVDNKEEKNSSSENDIPSGSKNVEKFLSPKVTLPKDIKFSSKDGCFSAQKDTRFEASDFFKNMILSGRELSPSMCKLTPGFRMSSLQAHRPSAYQKFEVPADPHKEALKAIALLSAKRTGITRTLSTIENIMPLSPFRDRGSFYTPSTDPGKEALKSLQELKVRKLKKVLSSKKVTFDLTVKECTPKCTVDIEAKELKNSESRLTQINEKSEENTPNSPHIERTVVLPLKQDHDNVITSEFSKSSDFIEHQEAEAASQANTQKNSFLNKEKCPNFLLETPVTKSVPSLAPDKSFSAHCKENLLLNLKNIDALPLSRSSMYDNMRVMCKTSAKHGRTVNVLSFEQKNLNSTNNKKGFGKVYTPRPVSFYSKSKLVDSCSPDFLTKGTSSTLAELAPICTPLVLKNIAKSNMLSPETDLSPVRLKLNFAEMEKDTPRRESTKNQTILTLENISTIQKKLDDLADQECCLLLQNETSTPIICGRYLSNPVAVTLSEGDDMHFIPILNYQESVSFTPEKPKCSNL